MRIKTTILLIAAIAVLCGCMKEPDRSKYPREEFVMVFYGAQCGRSRMER